MFLDFLMKRSFDTSHRVKSRSRIRHGNRTLRGISLRRENNCNKFPDDSLPQRTGRQTDGQSASQTFARVCSLALKRYDSLAKEIKQFSAHEWASVTGLPEYLCRNN
jgi:hypothetical protein